MQTNKVIFYSFSFNQGGAAFAANNFSKLLEGSYDVYKVSCNELTHVSTVEKLSSVGRLIHFIKRVTSFVLVIFQNDRNPIKHSLNFFGSKFTINRLKNNASTGSLINCIHWINNDTISIFDLDKIPSGSIITLHDEWLYCGAEHYYKIGDTSLDFVNGYSFFKKGVIGIHWNYIVWLIKFYKLSKRKDLIYTVPSRWMLERAKMSKILKDSNVRLLPNPIDTEIFSIQPINSIRNFRSLHGILSNDIVLSFGAIGGKRSFLKGSHLLESALEVLSKNLSDEYKQKIKLLDFGGKNNIRSVIHGFENISVGHISDKSILAVLYCASDCLIIPSLVESFGQVAAEALSCETPVVCFNYSGVTDIVIDGESGFLAKPYDVEDLARQIKNLILLDNDARLRLGRRGRRHVVENFSYSVISKKYNKIINDALLLMQSTRKT